MGKIKYKYQCLGKRKIRHIESLKKARAARKEKRGDGSPRSKYPEGNIIEVSTSSDNVGSMAIDNNVEGQHEADVNDESDILSNEYVLEVNNDPTFHDENVNNMDIDGSRIIDFRYFMEQLFNIDAHSQKFGCKLSQIIFLKEKQTGLISKFEVKCTMCGSIFELKTSEDQSNINMNLSAVSGAIITGIGHSALNELCASIDLPTMPFRVYSKCHDVVAEMWKNTAEETMKKAAEEEAEAAKLRGDINQAGIPMISVQADACWSKRSYKSNYSALSGVAAIIGEHSGKVMHVGVCNKYCVICVRDKKRQNSTVT